MVRTLAFASWALLFAWALAASFFPVGNFDVWVHLQVGVDVLRTGALPDVDAYSWTAAGRPFVAHEWLAGVLFAVVGGPTDGEGLTVLRVWVVALVAICAWISTPREVRASPATLVVAGLTLALVVARASVRPHLLSLLFVALLVPAFGAWRATRRPLALAWLVPLTLVWANIHGAFVLAPVLLVVLGGAVALAARFPALSPGDRERPFRGREAAQPFAVAVLCAGAALVNPYGADLFAFSFTMGTGNEYLKDLVIEWLPPWHPDLRGLLDPWLFAALLALTSVGLWLGRRRMSLVDVALLGALLVQALSAVRFLADFALFALPVAARLLAPAVDDRLGARARAFGCVVFPTALLVALVFFGPSLRTNANLPFALGFVRAPAADMVRHLHELGYEGGLFNEYEDGGYLVYAGKGRIKPVIDARIDIYGEKLVEAWRLARLQPELLPAYVDHYRVDAVLLAKGAREHEGHVRELLATTRWRVERENEGYVLLLRAGALQRPAKSS